MIAFDLECVNKHTFEGWFESNEALEEQKRRNLISCPICGSQEVEKVFSPFAIGNSKRKISSEEGSDENVARKAIKAFYEYLDTNFEDVGPDFAKEALKIHYGVSDKSNIKGSSTADEEELLREEGVNFLKIPVPRHDA